MKKIFAMILAGTMILSLAACGQKAPTPSNSANENAQIETPNNSVNETAPTTGGWRNADAPVVTDEVKALLEKATEGLTGANYIPVAYLGSQVVAGTNHAVLCRVSPVIPDAVETYAIVTLYEDTDGNVEISDVEDFGTETWLSDEALPGGWAQADSPVVTDEVKAVFEKAVEGLTGVSYTPVALISTQTVAGTNYCFLCEATVVVPDSEPSYVLAYVSEDLDGSAELGEIVELAADAEAGNAQIPNPFVDYDSLAEAAEAAGFDMIAPETMEGYSEKIIQVMNSKMIQVIFLNGDSRLFLRKAAGSEDISGDYNVYAETQTATFGDYSVTMKGDDGRISLAIWTDNGYTYAVTSDETMSVEDMSTLVSLIG